MASKKTAAMLNTWFANRIMSQTITLTGGTPPFQWSVYNGPILTGYKVGGAVPDGLKLAANSGTISGTPTAGGTWYFEAAVTDSTGTTVVDGNLSIQINSTSAPGNPVPFLNQPLIPTAVAPGASGFTLSVSGTGFVSGATVDFNHVPLATTFGDSQHLTATVLAAEVVNAGTAIITVVNPGPGGGSSNVDYLQVAAPETSILFAPAPNSPLQIFGGITAGDFNEDGKSDLAVTCGYAVCTFLGNGDGTFTQAPSSPVRVPSPPYDDFARPWSGLSLPAISTTAAIRAGGGEVNNEAAVILLGNGNGTFVPSSASFANASGMPLIHDSRCRFQRRWEPRSCHHVRDIGRVARRSGIRGRGVQHSGGPLHYLLCRRFPDGRGGGGF